jgi:two-component system sensor histidine kinase CreC
MRHLRLRYKLLISFIALNVVCTGTAAVFIYLEMRPHFLEAVEYTLIDMSRFLAAELSAEAEKSPDKILRTEGLRGATDQLFRTRFPERNGFDRANRSRLLIYVTDARGLVIFDSENQAVGQNYSGWRDVALSLQKQYGARATRIDPVDPATSIHYVAAPILSGEQVLGVISVGKPVESVAGFLLYSKMKILLIFGLSIAASLIFSAAATFWTLRPILRLSDYVNRLRTHQPVPYPRLPQDEIGALGGAFEKIRQELEGKKYVENYVHNLTHEIKSPLTGIIGAAELLDNGHALSDADRRKLLANVRGEALRLQDIAEKLLELASLEASDHAPKFEVFDLSLLLEEVVESFAAQAQQFGLKIELKVRDGLISQGERFLLWRATANLMQNAIDFSPEAGVILVSADQYPPGWGVVVQDQGPGIPDFAQKRVTERFFSMERPRTGRKSSGLGLSFVQEVMQIHNGELRLENQPTGGTKTTLVWSRGASGFRA